jgi:flagellar protein FliL
MSAAVAPAADAPAAKGGKKKLILIIAAVVVLALVGVGAFLMLKKKPAEDGEEAAASAKPAAKAVIKHDPKKPPNYLPLDMFVVNLADRESERYAQIGVTLEIGDAKDAEVMKTFMPAIRSNILMVLAHKTSGELLQREGKVKLAGEVQRAAARGMGIEVEDPEPAEAETDDEDKPKKKKKKKKAPEPVLPITAVHFSTFIVQ